MLPLRTQWFPLGVQVGVFIRINTTYLILWHIIEYKALQGVAFSTTPNSQKDYVNVHLQAFPFWI